MEAIIRYQLIDEDGHDVGEAYDQQDYHRAVADADDAGYDIRADRYEFVRSDVVYRT